MHDVGTGRMFKMHNVGTVPTYKTHKIGTELSYSTLGTTILKNSSKLDLIKLTPIRSILAIVIFIFVQPVIIFLFIKYE